jgi:hypothetical protein
MLSRRLYVASVRIAVVTIVLAAVSGVYAAYFPPQNVSFLANWYIFLSSILAGAAVLMVVGSFTKTDPDAHRHKSFRITKSLHDGSEETNKTD